MKDLWETPFGCGNSFRAGDGFSGGHARSVVRTATLWTRTRGRHCGENSEFVTPNLVVSRRAKVGERFCHKNKAWTSPAMAVKSASAVTTRARRSDARAREKRWLVASGEWLVKVNGDHIARMKRAKGMLYAVFSACAAS